MRHKTKIPSSRKKICHPSMVAVGIYVEGEAMPIEILLERAPTPDKFPRELVPYLTDYMARGFNSVASAARLKLGDLLRKARGRPIDPAVQQVGQEAAKLRKEGLTYGQIALKLCLRRTEHGHRCDKACADGIRQAAKPYLNVARGMPHKQREK